MTPADRTYDEDARIRKRSVNIAGHLTSVTLEEIFWRVLRDVAEARGLSLSALITEIDADTSRPGGLSGALRVYAMRHVMDARTNGNAADGPKN